MSPAPLGACPAGIRAGVAHLGRPASASLLLAALPGRDGLLDLGRRWLLHALFAGVARWFANGVTALLRGLVTALTTSAHPLVEEGWFAGPERAMLEVAGLLLLPLTLLGIGQCLLAGDVAGMVRVVLVRLPVAVVLGAAAVALVRLALRVVDGLCQLVEAGMHLRGPALYGEFHASVSALEASGLGAGSVLLLAIFAIVVLFLWFELIVRAAAIDACVLLLPVTLATLLWPATSGLARRLGETLAALVFAKLVIVAVLAVGTESLLRGIGHSSLQSAVEGAAMLLVATLAPFSLLRLAPFVEAGAIGGLEGLSSRARRRLGTTSERLAVLWPLGEVAPSVGPGEWEDGPPLLEGTPDLPDHWKAIVAWREGRGPNPWTDPNGPFAWRDPEPDATDEAAVTGDGESSGEPSDPGGSTPPGWTTPPGWEGPGRRRPDSEGPPATDAQGDGAWPLADPAAASGGPQVDPTLDPNRTTPEPGRVESGGVEGGLGDWPPIIAYEDLDDDE